MLEKTFGKKLIDKEYTDRQGAYAVIFTEDNKITLVKNPTGYFLLGGGIEKGETNEECIKRECIEEAGLAIEVKDFVCKSDIYRYSERVQGYMHGIGHFYNAEIVGKVCRPVEVDHELVTLEINEAIENLFLENQVYAVKVAVKNRK